MNAPMFERAAEILKAVSPARSFANRDETIAFDRALPFDWRVAPDAMDALLRESPLIPDEAWSDPMEVASVEHHIETGAMRLFGYPVVVDLKVPAGFMLLELRRAP